MKGVRLPVAHLRFRISKEGYRTTERAADGFYGLPNIELIPLPDDASEGMTRIPGGSVRVGSNDPIDLPAYWMDTFEVTNEEFQAFVDAGGYRDRAYWKQPIIRADRPLSRESAMELFEDATGQPGPAHWELGRYPEGPADPALAEAWSRHEPEYLLEDDRELLKRDLITAEAAGSVTVHGMQYELVERFPLTADRTWMLYRRSSPTTDDAGFRR